ncbi:MAG: hypothetical protein JWP25_3185 [Bradyrhizobium sp.]|nr:hypothetical protein [Bradyrhizobium sp.]
MSKFAMWRAVALLSIASAPAALAQAANSEPGFCAQFYSNEDCNSDGPPTPAAKTIEPSDTTATPAAAPAPAPAVQKQKHRAKAAAAAPAKPQ